MKSRMQIVSLAGQKVAPIMKRLLDLFVASLMLLILSPLMLLLGLFTRILLGRPVLFRQLRPGHLAKPFLIYKFRTMGAEKDENGNLLPDERRITPFGRFLRSTSLDELPELWNVLRGEMSLVGPRPLLMQYLPRYNEQQMRRHEAMPGITGWAQIKGRNAIDWDERLALDVWYVDHRSFWLDIKILLLTIYKIFSREGISAEGHATMPEFQGLNRNSK
jgi:sugar transferase EpsL